MWVKGFNLNENTKSHCASEMSLDLKKRNRITGNVEMDSCGVKQARPPCKTAFKHHQDQ